VRRLLICAVVVLALVAGYAVADAEDVVPGFLTLSAASGPSAKGSPAQWPAERPGQPVLAAPTADAPVPSASVLRAQLSPLVRHLGKGGTADVIDVATGRQLYTRSATTAGAPASTTKLLTAVSVLTGLGPDATLTTKVVQGKGRQIVLVGGGDIQLATGAGSSAAVFGRAGLGTLAALTATALKAAGRHTVTLGVDDSLFSGPRLSPHWVKSDSQTGLVGPITALGLAAKAPLLGRPSPADPSLAAAAAFAKALKHVGIHVSGQAHRVKSSAAATRLAAVESAPIRQLLTTTLALSDNTEAEVLARLGARAGGQAGSFTGAAAENVRRAKALGVPVTGIRLYDGSGLARHDRIAAQTLATLLTKAAMSPKPALRALFAALPVAGFTGTLAGRYRSGSTTSGAGVVRAKTGTLTGVNTLAGVAVDADGRLLAFAFMADHVVTSGDAARHLLDRAATVLAGCGCR
jgi:serine-type D-Ala-D-Ala carboxypeptidase/endopeptidase (penicillin-binding protein 4)